MLYSYMFMQTTNAIIYQDSLKLKISVMTFLTFLLSITNYTKMINV